MSIWPLATPGTSTRYFMVALGAVVFSLTVLAAAKVESTAWLIPIALIGLLFVIYAGVALARGLAHRLKAMPRPEFWSARQRSASRNAGWTMGAGAFVQLAGILCSLFVADPVMNKVASSVLLCVGFCTLLYSQSQYLKNLG